MALGLHVGPWAWAQFRKSMTFSSFLLPVSIQPKPICGIDFSTQQTPSQHCRCHFFFFFAKTIFWFLLLCSAGSRDLSIWHAGGDREMRNRRRGCGEAATVNWKQQRRARARMTTPVRTGRLALEARRRETEAEQLRIAALIAAVRWIDSGQKQERELGAARVPPAVEELRHRRQRRHRWPLERGT